MIKTHNLATNTNRVSETRYQVQRYDSSAHQWIKWKTFLEKKDAIKWMKKQIAEGSLESFSINTEKRD